MGQQIYNEGRVVGFSAWEIFARTSLNNGVPQEAIPDERQWLTAMIGSGASMILKVPANTSKGILDVEMPSGSNLTAAGVILANPFLGECEWDSISGWATKVTSYSSLAQNTSTDNPPDSDGNIPADSDYSHSDYKQCVSEFAKITDGIVFTQDANWIDSKPQEDTFTGDGTTVTFTLSSRTDSLDSVTIDGEAPTTTYTLDTTTNTVTFGTAPDNASEIVITYNSLPAKDINPNFNQSKTVVRLYISSDIQHDTAVLLTGFANKRILQGMSAAAEEDGGGYAVGGSTDVDENDWANGGMLGPEVIPWASKIIFCVPNSTYNLDNSLTRTIPADTEITNPAYDDETLYSYTLKNLDRASVNSTSFLDFNSIQLTDYYDKHSLASSIIVEDIYDASSTTCNELVAWYPGMTADAINASEDASNFFPPALYAAQVTSSGMRKELVPIDVASPGTVKCFKTTAEAVAYKTLLPNNYAIYYNNTYKTFSFVTSSNSSEWPGTAKITYATGQNPKATITAGSKQVGVVALTKSDAAATPYNTSGSSGVLNPADPTNKLKPNRYLTWDNMLNSLYTGKKFDVLGDRLENVGDELAQDKTMGENYQVKSLKLTSGTGGSRVATITPAAGATSASDDVVLSVSTGIKSGANFIEFPGKIRLYISKSAPTGDIPTGSIGIGW